MLPGQKKAFDDFYKSVRQNKILDDKTSLLVHLGAAMAVGCYPCMKHCMSQVDEEGVSDDKINAVESIVSAGRVPEQFSEVLTGKGTCD